MALLLIGIILWGLVPADRFLRDIKTGGVLNSPYLRGIVAIVFFGGTFVGLAYGIGAGTSRSDSDVMKAMEKAMATMALYLVLAFFSSLFVAFFNWTHLGVITAVKGAEILRSSGIGGVPLIICFIMITVPLDLRFGSPLAELAEMAPVFVPFLTLLGHSPRMTHAGYAHGAF